MFYEYVSGWLYLKKASLFIGTFDKFYLRGENERVSGQMVEVKQPKNESEQNSKWIKQL